MEDVSTRFTGKVRVITASGGTFGIFPDGQDRSGGVSAPPNAAPFHVVDHKLEKHLCHFLGNEPILHRVRVPGIGLRTGKGS